MLVGAGVSSVVKGCRSSLYWGTDLSQWACVFTEAPYGHPAMRNTCPRHKERKKKEEGKKGFVKWLLGCAAVAVRPGILRCYHRKTGLSASEWHWIEGHGGLKLTLLSDLKGEPSNRPAFPTFLRLQLQKNTFISILLHTCTLCFMPLKYSGVILTFLWVWKMI